MLDHVTSGLELAAAVAWIAGVSLAAYLLTGGPWGVVVALGVGGATCLAASFALQALAGRPQPTRRGERR